jgi:hypothetical protein
MKKLLVVKLLLATLLLSGYAYSQTEPHSGVLHVSSDTEQFNLIKIHCDALADVTVADKIKAEYAKYKPQIESVDIDAPNKKIYIKYRNSIDPNMLLGILERVHFSAFYYNSQNTPVVYTKTGTENFRR